MAIMLMKLSRHMLMVSTPEFHNTRVSAIVAFLKARSTDSTNLRVVTKSFGLMNMYL